MSGFHGFGAGHRPMTSGPVSMNGITVTPTLALPVEGGGGRELVPSPLEGEG